MAPLQSWLSALRWVMTQPGLLNGLPGGSTPLMAESDPRLEALLSRTQRQPDGLMTLLEGPRGHKVGIAYEALMLWGLTQGLGYQCLGRDVQVFDLGRTIGALDLVLRSPKGQIEHWELAYKVYLQAQAYAEWEHWVGPGQRDRLDRKVRRMLDHQVPLSTHPASHAALQSLGVAQIDARRVMLQGVLFRPWGEPASWAEDAPHEAKGRWFRPSQLESVLQANPGGQWWQRMKPHWFGPWGFNEKEGLSADSFRIRCQTTPVTRPEMWTTTSKSGADDGDVFFLVPETWGA